MKIIQPTLECRGRAGVKVAMLKKDQVKLVCLIIFIVGFIAVLLSDNRVTQTARAFSSGPPDGHTGAPGELTCSASGCHTGTVNSGPGRLIVEAPSVYEPGQTYQITVKHMTNDSSRRRWGFQLTALTTSNDPAGTLASVSGLTQTLTGGPRGDRQYIEHSIAGTFQGQTGGCMWTFNWTAPSTDVGPVVFYAAGNQANNDSNNTGDQIYTTTAVAFSGPPEIDSASVSGKKLFVEGKNFANGATLYMCQCNNPATDGSRVKKASNDNENPFSLFVAKKAGKSIERGQTVQLQLKNPDGTLSNVFTFTRPQ